MAVTSYVNKVGWSSSAGTTWGAQSQTSVNGSGTNIRKLWCPNDGGIQAGDYIFLYSIHKGAGAGSDEWGIANDGTAVTLPAVTTSVDTGTGSSPESQTWIIKVAAGDIGNYWWLSVPAGAAEGICVGHAYRFSDIPTYNGTGSSPDYSGTANTADSEDPVTVSVTKTDRTYRQVGVFVGGSAVAQPDTQTFTSVSGMTLELLDSDTHNNALNTFDYDWRWYHVETDAFSTVTFEWDRTGTTGSNGATAVAWPETGAPLDSSLGGWGWHTERVGWQVVRGM